MINFDFVRDRRGTYCTQWDYTVDRFGESDLLPFSISDTDFDVPESVQQVIFERAQHPIYGYTRWNHSDFKRSVADFFARRFATEIAEDWVIYSPSVMYSISLLIRLLTAPGARVVTFSPMYDAFFSVIEENERVLISNPLRCLSGRYEIDFPLLEKQLKTADLFLLCSPHNPTGRVWTEKEWGQMLALCRRYQVPIVSDEIHMDIQMGVHPHRPLLHFLSEYPALYTASSASKTFNTPALQGSYVLIPDVAVREAFVHHLRKVDFLNSPSVFGMLATMAAYREGADYIQKLCTYVRGNFDRLEAFTKTHPLLRFTPPEATYLAWVDVRALPCSMETLQQLLIQKGKLGIMDGATYGEEGRGYLRMNLGCPRVKLDEGLRRLSIVLSEWEE